jgi:hypothetical protein
MRRFFSTMLRADGMNEAVVKYMQGHGLGVEAGYLIPNEDLLRNLYTKHYDKALALRGSEVDRKRQLQDMARMVQIVDMTSAERKKLARYLETGDERALEFMRGLEARGIKPRMKKERDLLDDVESV